MLSIYKSDARGTIDTVEDIATNTWIDLISPTRKEIQQVVDQTSIPEELILTMLDKEELPRIENEGDATLIVIDVPYIENKAYVTMPLGIIMNKDYLVTVGLASYEVLKDIKNNKIKTLHTAKKSRFIIQLLHRVSAQYVRYLNAINQGIESKEKILKRSTNNRDLLELLNIQKSLVYFVTSLKANDVLLERISKGVIFNLYDEDLELIEDAIIESRQGIETANIYREILKTITDTYANVISNNLNGIMKFLAGITIVSTVPTMVASFMGMNVPLGSISENPHALIIVVLISISVATLIAIVLKKQDML